MKKEILAKKLKENLQRRKSKSSTILAIETCFKGLSVALLEANEIDMHVSNEAQMQSTLLPDIVKNMIVKAANKIDFIITNKGPGAFTGLRVGVSFAQGYCFGDINIKPLFCTSFEAMLGNIENVPNNLLVIIKAIRDTFYISFFKDKKFVGTKYVTLDELNIILENQDYDIICNDSSYAFKGNIIKDNCIIDAENIIKCYKKFPHLFSANYLPLYIRSFNA